MKDIFQFIEIYFQFFLSNHILTQKIQNVQFSCFIIETIFAPPDSCYTEAVVVLDHVARAAERLVPGRGKAKKSGELHSQPGKVVTERGGRGNIQHI